MEFDFEVVHRAKIKRQPADALSRMPINASGRTMLEDDLPIIAVIQLNKQALTSPSIDTADGSHAKISSIFGNDWSTLLKFI